MIKTVVVLLLLTGWLRAEALTMAEFRLQQRHLALAEFKSLYKQRHYYQHRANLLRHHRRVKRIVSNRVMPHGKPSRDDGHVAETSETAMSHLIEGSETSLKIKANYEMEHLETLLSSEEGGMHGEPTVPHVPPSGDSGQNGGTGSGSGGGVPDPGEHPGTSGGMSGGDVPSQESGVPSQGKPDDGGSPAGGENGSGTGMQDGGMAESGGKPDDGPADVTDTPSSEPQTLPSEQAGGQNEGESQLPDGADSGIRTRFADPWRRR